MPDPKIQYGAFLSHAGEDTDRCERLAERLRDEGVRQRDVNFSRFEHLVKSRKIVLIFDAFDEMADRVRWDETKTNFSELRNSATRSEVVYLQEFSGDQVRAYLEKARPKTAKKDWRKIQRIYNLPELAHRPMLLDMIVKSLPQIEAKQEINAATLYNVYTSFWLEREEKDKGRFLNRDASTTRSSIFSPCSTLKTKCSPWCSAAILAPLPAWPIARMAH